MGLMERAESLKGGLLNVAQAMLKKELENAQTFSNLCASFSFVHAGIFKETDGRLVLHCGIGIDAVTASTSVATKGYWTGTIPDENKWYKPDGFAFEDFYQLFNPDLVDSITSVAFLRFTSNADMYIVMVYSLQGEEFPELPENLSTFCSVLLNSERNKEKSAVHLDDSVNGLPASLYIIPMAVALDKSIEGINLITEQIQQEVLDSLFDELVTILYRGIKYPNIVSFTENREFKIALFNPSEIDEKLFLEHIKLETKKILGESVEFINLLPAGLCRNEKGIQDFILKY